jgi:hypothetical protein
MRTSFVCKECNRELKYFTQVFKFEDGTTKETEYIIEPCKHCLAEQCETCDRED